MMWIVVLYLDFQMMVFNGHQWMDRCLPTWYFPSVGAEHLRQGTLRHSLLQWVCGVKDYVYIGGQPSALHKQRPLSSACTAKENCVKQIIWQLSCQKILVRPSFLFYNFCYIHGLCFSFANNLLKIVFFYFATFSRTCQNITCSIFLGKITSSQ